MSELSIPRDVLRKYVLKCSINRVVDGVRQCLFFAISGQGRYVNYLDLAGGKINEGVNYYSGRNEENRSIKLLSLSQEMVNRSYLFMRSEGLMQCLQREVLEETDILLDCGKIKYVSTHELSIKGGEELLVLIRYNYDLGEAEEFPIKLSLEHTAFYRLTEEQMEKLKANIVPSLRHVLGLTTQFFDEEPRALEPITL